MVAERDDEIAGLEQVAVRYGSGPEILRDVSMQLGRGSFHFLVGPSGAGKTSLLRLLYLALRPSRGRVMLFGREIDGASPAEAAGLRRRVGVVFQDFRLLPHLSVYDNVALPLHIAGHDEAGTKGLVTPMLARLGLQGHAGAHPPSLSGGQQQLVAIARALIVRPRLLIADEPTASVDEALALRLVRLFQELNRLGTTVLIATHNERLAAAVRQPRLRLDGGRLVEAPSPRRVPIRHAPVAALSVHPSTEQAAPASISEETA